MSIAERPQVPDEPREASLEEPQKEVYKEQGRRGQYIVNGDKEEAPGRGQYIAGRDSTESHDEIKLNENEPPTS